MLDLDSAVRSWSHFTIFNVDALTFDKAKKLIEKLPKFQDIKKPFLKDLKEIMSGERKIICL